MSHIADEPIMMGIKTAIGHIMEEIGKATLVAVSKKRSVISIKEAYSTGIRDFGESYLQEALPKIEALKDLDITWHFIGNLQKNKVKKVVEHFDVIQSVNSIALAEEIDKRAEENKKIMDVMVEIYLGDEDPKTGAALDDARQIIDRIKELANIKLIGIMMMTPSIDIEKRRKYFREAKMFYDD
ncbi:YggS family pyridoxal phosphate-dependent enzyme, partial [Candidatus Woesearchaeota archaeon CG11_big_fil_rev_8_21_14_0_20_43_8]